MKIVHICLSGIVTDGFSYQDNLLSKYHKKMGHDVTFITSKWSYNEKGEIVKIQKTNYYNEDGVFMIRLESKNNKPYSAKFKKYLGIEEKLKNEKPDVLFIHGPQFLEMVEVVNFLKNEKKIKVYVDNHADFSNSGRNWISKNILHGIIWKKMAKMIEPYTEKFYGVLPSRVDFLQNIYKIPKEKTELLVMGADDELVYQAENTKATKMIRQKYGIQENDFLIVTGGKIDEYKKQTLLLMEAVQNIDNDNLKLIVFGSVEKNIEDKLKSLCDGEKVQYVGWANSQQSYEYFSVADMVVFPGRHSVYWEQVAGMGIPMLCKYWEGTTHVDVGGNVKFLRNDSVREMQEIIQELLEHPDMYREMLRKAQTDARRQFSYNHIAKKSIE